MLTEVLTHGAFYAYLLTPLLFAILIGVGIGRYWSRNLGDKEKRYNAEVFRNPINATLTLIGIVIPLLSVCVAYLRSTLQVDTSVLAPLVASSIVFIVAIIISLWNLYSLATVTDEQQVIVVNKKDNLYFPAFFVGQLALLLAALVSISFFLLFHFRVPPSSAAASSSAQLHCIVKPPARLGMTNATLRDLWGRPELERPSSGGSELVYRSIASEFIITTEGGKVKSVLERTP